MVPSSSYRSRDQALDGLTLDQHVIHSEVSQTGILKAKGNEDDREGEREREREREKERESARNPESV